MSFKRPNSNDTNWTLDEVKEIYRLRHDEKLSWRKIEERMKTKSWKAISRKYGRTNWKSFFKDPEAYDKRFGVPRKWSNDEMIQLDAFIQADQSYDFIAQKMGRSLTSVESRAQQTDWQEWKKLKDIPHPEPSNPMSQETKQSIEEKLVGALISFCRHEFDRIDSIKESEFLSRINMDKDRLPVSFNELRKMAKEELISMGLGNPITQDLPPGTYVIVGDSHGKHTRKEMFSLLDRVNSTIKPKKIIHIGHILDDDNDISYDWGRYSNLIILAKAEELRLIQEQRNRFKFNYDIIREDISMGDLIVSNQDMITDYVKTAISSLDTQVFDDSEKVIVNCHRLEFSTRCCNGEASYIASPGCLCEKHTVRSIKQINFEDGRVVKQSYPDGFIKYRRMGQTNKYWEHGLLVVNMDKQKNVTIVPCVIKHTPKGPAISYFDKIITPMGIYKPDKKIFVNGDLHCDMHDVNVLDIQERICKDYKPDVQVNVGDTFNYSSLNHHVMDRGGIIMDKKILDEAAQVNFVLRRCSKWAKISHLIYGNHERFAGDFVEKYPQFGHYLDFRFICNIDDMGYLLTPLKNVLKIGSVKMIHGEMKMFGQSGSKLEKAARVFGGDIFIGHIHRPEIRFGCYSVGMAGLLDQSYNDSNASNWLHGFGMCNQFMGHSFLTTIAIDNYKCTIGNKTYRPANIDSWKMKKYSARLSYQFGK